MSEIVSLSSETGTAGEGYVAFAYLNEGFLGTGYSTSVELSFITMALIAGYVAYGTYRYFMPNARILGTVAEALGLKDR